MDAGARAETSTLLNPSCLAASAGPGLICPTRLRKPFRELKQNQEEPPERARQAASTHNCPEGSQWQSLSVWNESSVSWNGDVSGKPRGGFGLYLSITGLTRLFCQRLLLSLCVPSKEQEGFAVSKTVAPPIQTRQSLTQCSQRTSSLQPWPSKACLPNMASHTQQTAQSPDLAQPSLGAGIQVGGTGLASAGSSVPPYSRTQSYLAQVGAAGEVHWRRSRGGKLREGKQVDSWGQRCLAGRGPPTIRKQFPSVETTVSPSLHQERQCLRSCRSRGFQGPCAYAHMDVCVHAGAEAHVGVCGVYVNGCVRVCAGGGKGKRCPAPLFVTSCPGHAVSH